MRLIAEPDIDKATLEDWQRFILRTTIQGGGFMLVDIANMETDGVPVVRQGSRLEINGAFYKAEADEAVGGSPASGENFVYAVPNGDGVTFQYSAVKPEWSAVKGGWYNGNNRAVLRVAHSGGVYYFKEILDRRQGNENMSGNAIQQKKILTSIIGTPVKTITPASGLADRHFRLEPGVYCFEVAGGAGGGGGGAGGAGAAGGQSSGSSTYAGSNGGSGGAGGNGEYSYLAAEGYLLAAFGGAGAGGGAGGGGPGFNGWGGSAAGYSGNADYGGSSGPVSVELIGISTSENMNQINSASIAGGAGGASANSADGSVAPAGSAGSTGGNNRNSATGGATGGAGTNGGTGGSASRGNGGGGGAAGAGGGGGFGHAGTGGGNNRNAATGGGGYGNNGANGAGAASSLLHFA